ncbi:hypothetical protein [Nonomuraea sp. NPDC049607]|uniref:hypothetical protein n=1 Tax=Nonomuraea sp. NPDC049607 TaxID=3154732 RepID=UPI003420494E
MATVENTHNEDARFTFGLVSDVLSALETHGYRLPDEEGPRHRALGETLARLAEVTRVFEGGAS